MAVRLAWLIRRASTHEPLFLTPILEQRLVRTLRQRKNQRLEPQMESYASRQLDRNGLQLLSSAQHSTEQHENRVTR